MRLHVLSATRAPATSTTRVRRALAKAGAPLRRVTESRDHQPAGPARKGWGGLAPAACAYLLLVAAAAAATGLPLAARVGPETSDWFAFLVLGGCAAVAEHFIVTTGRNHGFPMAITFLVAAALLLPPELVALMAIVQHLPDLAQRRYPWFIQTFNISNYTLNALAAWAAAHVVFSTASPESAGTFAAAGLAAAIAFVGLNHVLLACMLRLARGHTFRASGLFAPMSLFTDLVLAGLGLVLARLWPTDPYLVPAIATPIVLVQRSLSMASLLRQSEERFRAMFEGAAIGTCLMDMRGHLLATNRALEEMLGFSKDELVGTLGSQYGDPDDGHVERTLFAEMLAGKREHYRVERRLVRRDGSVVPAEVTVSLVPDADGKPQFAIVMAEDMSDRRELEEQLRHSQKMEAVGRLAGGVAHDFNNLLTVIKGHGRFLLEQLDPGELRRDAEGIMRATERAASLTGQLLAFSRKQVLQPRVIDLNQVVAGLDGMLKHLTGRDVVVEIRLEPDVGHVKADPNQIEQVLLNLIINARDAMAERGRLTIETANAKLEDTLPGTYRPPKPGRYVQISVSDTGCGIDEETRARIIEPFFTTKPRDKGTGLGLSTVYGIVSQSNGYLAVESEPGQGSTFSIYLPRVDQPADADPSPAPANVDGNSETVLLVDDDDGVRSIARRYLARRGFVVLEAFDAAEAARIAERHADEIALLLTDVVMPEVDGIELAGEVMAIRPDVKVLFMSGYTDGAAIETVSGAASFIQKPFSEEELAAKVRAVLDEPAATTPMRRS